MILNNDIASANKNGVVLTPVEIESRLKKYEISIISAKLGFYHIQVDFEKINKGKQNNMINKCLNAKKSEGVVLASMITAKNAEVKNHLAGYIASSKAYYQQLIRSSSSAQSVVELPSSSNVNKEAVDKGSVNMRDESSNIVSDKYSEEWVSFNEEWVSFDRACSSKVNSFDQESFKAIQSLDTKLNKIKALIKDSLKDVTSSIGSFDDSTKYGLIRGYRNRLGVIYDRIKKKGDSLFTIENFRSINIKDGERIIQFKGINARESGSIVLDDNGNPLFATYDSNRASIYFMSEEEAERFINALQSRIDLMDMIGGLKGYGIDDLKRDYRGSERVNMGDSLVQVGFTDQSKVSRSKLNLRYVKSGGEVVLHNRGSVNPEYAELLEKIPNLFNTLMEVYKPKANTGPSKTINTPGKASASGPEPGLPDKTVQSGSETGTSTGRKRPYVDDPEQLLPEMDDVKKARTEGQSGDNVEDALSESINTGLMEDVWEFAEEIGRKQELYETDDGELGVAVNEDGNSRTGGDGSRDVAGNNEAGDTGGADSPQEKYLQKDGLAEYEEDWATCKLVLNKFQFCDFDYYETNLQAMADHESKLPGKMWEQQDLDPAELADELEMSEQRMNRIHNLKAELTELKKQHKSVR